MLATERTVATLLVASLAAAAAAQCPNAGTWAPLDAHAAPFGSVHALLAWDPDGPGPLGEHVVCGGAFSFVGSQAIANVALYDPATQTYAPMGAGFDGPVRALALFGNDVIAAGDFSASGATAVSNLARWNGAAWGDVGGGVTGPVHALEAAGATLYVGGAIVQAGGLGASGLAAWDGQSWSATALGVVRFQQNPAATLPGVVHGLAFDAATGRLYVGGAFDRAGATVLANGVASWDGAAWSSLGHAPRTFEAMTLRANGELWLSSTDSSNLSQLFRWNGAALLAVGQPEQTGFALLDELTNGTLVGGRSDYFTAFGEFAEWTGAAWMPRQGSELLGLPRAFLELGIGDELLGMERTSGDLLAMRRGTAGGYGPPASGRDGIVRSL
ncbi:MAG: hypothetical protein KAI24_04575, partial [Planctomycetes bacterium]|nr:hypothetical protein [Planctomycetota bacterium]